MMSFHISLARQYNSTFTGVHTLKQLLDQKLFFRARRTHRLNESAHTLGELLFALAFQRLRHCAPLSLNPATASLQIALPSVVRAQSRAFRKSAVSSIARRLST